MRVLGIDPGSNVTGWGVVRMRRGRYQLVAAGCVRTKRSASLAERMVQIHDGLHGVFEAHTPDEVGIEAIFRHKSSESALRLGQARGVALLVAAQHGHDPASYNPMTVKRTIGAHGRATKDAVAKMVEMLLGRTLDLPADATDALAIAMTHCAHRRGRTGAR